eukprot:s148_g25.t1
MTGRSSSSPTSSSKGICHDGDPASDAAIARLVAEDLKVVDATTSVNRQSVDHTTTVALSTSKATDVHNARIKQLEDEYLAQMVEVRLEVQKAQKAEQKLRVDRDEWKLMAENLQPKEEEGGGDDGECDDEEEYHDAGDRQTPDPPSQPDGGGDDRPSSSQAWERS